MTVDGLSPSDSEFARDECRLLRGHVDRYVDHVTATERYALGGAAALAAFSVTGLPQVEGARALISALPAVILALAALRCLTFYLVIRATLAYVEDVENVLLSDPRLGYQRRFAPSGERINRGVEAVSGGFWALAVLAAAVFWLLVNDVF